MRRLISSLVLALALLIVARTTNGIITITWVWVSYPGQDPPGQWVPVNVEPYMPGY